MIKLLIGFTRSQVEWIRREAHRREISVSEFFRRLVDNYRKGGQP